MTINDLISKMNLYKKEIYRRGIAISLCVLLPGIIIIVAAGLWLKPFAAPEMWKTISFYAALIVFLVLNVGLFAYTVTISLPRKLDLFCPQCHKSILKIDPQILVQTGRCDQCSTMIVERPDNQSQTPHSVTGKSSINKDDIVTVNATIEE